jgi:hypothetical protein
VVQIPYADACFKLIGALAGFVALNADASNGAILTMYVDIVVASEI